ncbi:MAG: hypothetical protein N4A71_26985 [Carboxylicivirga sp.]|jgi:hypothetical protein|nr:hypothetical protein [Carboxylicivirga sp.]
MVSKWIVLLILLFILSFCNNNVPFDSAKWKSSGGEMIITDHRLRMTENLLERQLLLNKNQSKIDSILGLPITIAHETEEKKYYLVQEVYKNNIDPIYIILIKVDFDDNGKSIRAELVTK